MGGSSSKQSTSTTNVREDFVFTNSGGGESVNIGKGNAVTINKTDGETAVAALEEGRKLGEAAFDEAFGFGGEALDFAEGAGRLANDSIGDAFDSIENIVRNSARQVDRSLQVAESSQTDDSAETLQSLFKYGALTVGGLALVTMFARRK